MTVKGGTLRWSKHSHTWIPLTEWFAEQAKYATAVARSDLACPMIISDQLNDLRSMADGRVYTSKSAYYASLKAHGCHIVANDNPSSYVSKPNNEKHHEADIAADVKRAYAEVESQ